MPLLSKPYRIFILRGLSVFAAVACFLGGVAVAQVKPKPFTINAYASGANTLAGGGMNVVLWGVEPITGPDTIENTRARVALDEAIGDKQVRCMPMAAPSGGVVKAQCLNIQERDLSLHLIASGVVTVKRTDVMGSDLANAYLGAEAAARAQKLGFWGMGMAAGSAALPAPVASAFDALGLGGMLPPWAVAGGLLIVPLLGFLMMALILHSGFRQMIALQKYQLAGTQKRERQLKDREKQVIAAALVAELNTNRAKLDAFITIYDELLKSLRDPSKKPKYQRAGDIVHEKPALSRTVYDAHMDKLDILGPQLSSDLNNLYHNIDSAPGYRTLEPELSIEKAREIIDRIVKNAGKMAEPVDKILAALSIIVRDKKSGNNG